MTAVDLARINDGGAQMRAETRPETVQDYAEDMLDGATFPPIILYFDGADHWLADGFHRVEAARKIERDSIDAEIREGTKRDAILHGIGSNASHGLRRSQADKRRAVERLLTDPEWAQWSDRKVAEIAKVDHKTVGKIRRELSGKIPTAGMTLAKFKQKFGQGGEIPKPNGSVSVMASVLASLSDEVLIAECRRRGLAVADA